MNDIKYLMSFIPFPSIEQYRNVIKEFRYHKNLDPELNSVITFTGTIKLHGTNAGVVYVPETGTVYAQSRHNIITPEKDNANFAKYVDKHRTDIIRLMAEISAGLPGHDYLVLYGEWCGGNIQKGVGISGLPIMFVVFACCTHNNQDDSNRTWFPLDQPTPPLPESMYYINQFPVYTLDIDLENPGVTQNRLAEITAQVERECPVAKHFGVDNGVGEGVVWVGRLHRHDVTVKDLRFKVKGTQHSVTKVRTLANVDVEKLNSIKEFIEYAVTEQRLNQGYMELFPEGLINKSDIHKFVSWVKRDIIKEETDTLNENQLKIKDVSADISFRASKWLLDRIE